MLVFYVKIRVLSQTAFLTRQPCSNTATASPDPNWRQGTPPPSLAPILTEENQASRDPSPRTVVVYVFFLFVFVFYVKFLFVSVLCDD